MIKRFTYDVKWNRLKCDYIHGYAGKLANSVLKEFQSKLKEEFNGKIKELEEIIILTNKMDTDADKFECMSVIGKYMN